MSPALILVVVLQCPCFFSLVDFFFFISTIGFSENFKGHNLTKRLVKSRKNIRHKVDKQLIDYNIVPCHTPPLKVLVRLGFVTKRAVNTIFG